MLRTLFPFLVLRGSKSRPDVPLLDALREYEATKEERDRLSAQLEEAEQKLKILEETALDIREAKRPLPETEDEEEEARIRQRIIEGDPTIPAEMRRYIQKLQHKVQVYEQTRSEATESWVSAHLVLNRTMKQFIAGGIAGAVARTAVAPIDRVKILMQTQHITYQGETRYHNILGTMRTVWKDEGLHRLWRGNVTNVVRVVPYAATQFTSYDYFKQHILRWSTARNSDSGEGPVLELTTPQRLFAGACAGMTATTITHPLDVVRLRLNVQPELRGAWDAMRSIAQEGLLRGMFKGYVPTVISLSPFIAINFATFDQLQTMSFRLAASASGQEARQSLVFLLWWSRVSLSLARCPLFFSHLSSRVLSPFLCRRATGDSSSRCDSVAGSDRGDLRPDLLLPAGHRPSSDADEGSGVREHSGRLPNHLPG